MGFNAIFKPAGAAGVTSYANYGALPSGSAGDWGSTSDDGRAWRYNATASLWIPAELHTEGLTVLNNDIADADYWDGDATADAGGDQTYDAATDVHGAATFDLEGVPVTVLNGWAVPAISSDGATTFGDSGMGSGPYIEVVGTGQWLSQRYSSWATVDSDRYLVVLDWNLTVGANLNAVQLRIEDGTYYVQVAGYVSALNEIGFMTGGSLSGEGRAVTTSGTPVFVVFDLSSANATSRIIVPSKTAEPTLERTNAGTSGGGPRFTLGVSNTSTVTINRCQIYELG